MGKSCSRVAPIWQMAPAKITDGYLGLRKKAPFLSTILMVTMMVKVTDW